MGHHLHTMKEGQKADRKAQVDMKRHIRQYWKSGKQGKGDTEQPGVMRNVRLAVLFCFIAGIIVANIIDKSKMSGFGFWNSYFVEQFKYARIRPGELFYSILEQRLPGMLLLLLLSATSLGSWAGGIYLAWQGFAAGFLMAVSVVSYGIKGILLFGTALFPQYFLYIPVYIACLYLAVFFRNRIRAKGVGSGILHRREGFLFLAICLLFLGVYITGILLESYVNPFLLKKILKIF